MSSSNATAPPRFSVLITVRDRTPLLEQCLGSLAACMGEATGELVVVVDGGAPEAMAMEGAVATREGWTHRFVGVPAGGPARARNAVLPGLRGELVLFLNDDVRFEPGLLAAHDHAHRARPGHAVMGNTRWAPEVIDSEFMHWVAHHDSFYYLVPAAQEASWEYFHTMNLSLDRRWIDEGARFDEAFPFPAFEDTELGLRLWNQGMRLTMAWDAVLYHIHHFTPAQYVEKSRERGRSAHRFCQIFPDLEERIVGEYHSILQQSRGWKSRLERWIGAEDPLEHWQREIAAAFVEGYKQGI